MVNIVAICLIVLTAMVLNSSAIPPGYGGYGGHRGSRLFNRNYAGHDGGDSYADDKGSRYHNAGGVNRGLSHRNNHNHGGTRYRNRGNVDDGFSKVYHKEEYARNNDFYDDNHDDNLQQHYGYDDNRHDEYGKGHNDDYRDYNGRRGGSRGYGGQFDDQHHYDDNAHRYYY